MQPESLSEAGDWLQRAQRDLDAASRILSGDGSLPDIAVYHAQQAAEKALKGFLAAHDQIIPKIHDLMPLVVACQNFDGDFARFAEDAEILTPYATLFRYPGGPLEPLSDEADDAIRRATEIVRLVNERLRSD